MKLTGLQSLYTEMRKENVTFCVFPFRKDKVDFDIFYDIVKDPHKLCFIPKLSDLEILIDVKTGFIIDTYLDTQYNILKKILGINDYGKTPFSTKLFFEEFNSKIPPRLINSESNRKTLIEIARSTFKIENPNNIYYLSNTNWDDPKHKGNGNRTPQNLTKTRLLYPNIYLLTKDRNISINYTDKNRNIKFRID